MCLGIPSKIISIEDSRAKIDVYGAQRDISLMLLEDQVKIGDYVTVSPGSGIMGRVTVGDGVFIGAHATITDRIRIGNGAIVAAGAVVVQDVPEMSLVAGVPARVKKIYKSVEEKPW